MQTLLNKIKRIFLRFTVREKLLFLITLFVLLAFWTSSLINRTSLWNEARIQAQTDLELQQQWLDRNALYTEGLNRALQRVDPTKTYSGTQLSGRIDAILRQAKLAGLSDIDPVRSREGEIFNDHNLRVRLSRTNMEQFIELNRLLGRETPYINLQSVRLTANRRNPLELDARIEINSFDLKDGIFEN